MHPMINIAVKAARQAGKTILSALEHLETIQVSLKSRNDFVTEIDKIAEQEITEIILNAYPHHSILAEEGTEASGNQHLWIIDPLDGTTNFIHGFPHFAISIAVKYRDQIEHGVIYDPIRQDLFTATRGGGAKLNEKKIRVSPHKKLEGSLVGTGFPYAHPQQLKMYLKTFEELFPKVSGIRRCGSAALDLAYVAAGYLDGFWEFNLQPWDIAAGALMIKEAGGITSDLHGGENYIESGNIIAGNPKIHKEILESVQKALEE
ncbi:MAG: inositol monophosphatase [Gammaproteobacteria bacterium]|nr:inositol monophosphatase [Gammaproteobacteria bacterium]